MMGLEIILPQASAVPQIVQDRLDALCVARLQAFSAQTLAFLEDFSATVLQDTALRQHPEIIALAYWFRPAALKVLHGSFQQIAQRGLLRPRGVVFHIAPANVDTVFVYSWFLSLLCGNRNIIRLSKRENAQRGALLQILASLLQRPKHEAIARANMLISYGREDALTRELSERCHLRVVWGGDATVAHIRAIPLPPLATELVFPNRDAWALLNAEALLNASAEVLSKLAHDFYNDTFWFAQQACSSPRAVLWIGTSERVAAAQARFWPALAAVLQQKHAQDEPAQLAERLVAVHQVAGENENENGLKRLSALQDWPLRMEATALTESLRRTHCGYGLLYEVQRPNLAAANNLLTAADQTIAYWGFTREELTDWVISLADRAVDRIVPIGKALQFGEQWDGQDLLMAFSRRVHIE